MSRTARLCKGAGSVALGGLLLTGVLVRGAEPPPLSQQLSDLGRQALARGETAQGADVLPQGTGARPGQRRGAARCRPCGSPAGGPRCPSGAGPTAGRSGGTGRRAAEPPPANDPTAPATGETPAPPAAEPPGTIEPEKARDDREEPGVQRGLPPALPHRRPPAAAGSAAPRSMPPSPKRRSISSRTP